MNELDLSASLTMDASDFDRKVNTAMQSGRKMQSALTAQLDAVNREIDGVLRNLNTLTEQNLSPFLGLNAPAAESPSFSHATGLDYVPFNDYRARLHEGEAVLTKPEATEWRRGSGTASLDTSTLASAITSAVREGLRGMSVRMDGQAVGNVVTQTVSRNLAQEAYAGRYAT